MIWKILFWLAVWVVAAIVVGVAFGYFARAGRGEDDPK